MNDEDVKAKFSNNKEIANYYDTIKNINKTVEYSFIVCQEDPNDTISITKIVYWASFCREYDDIIKLLGMIRGNKIQIDKAKEIFYRENRRTIKDLLVKYYIDTVQKKELLLKSIKETKDANAQLDRGVSDHLRSFYRVLNELDIYPLYDEYINELSIVSEYEKILLPDN